MKNILILFTFIMMFSGCGAHSSEKMALILHGMGQGMTRASQEPKDSFNCTSNDPGFGTAYINCN